MTPADPIWLLAEVLASLARAFRSYRERKAERRAVPAWLAGRSDFGIVERFASLGSPLARPEPETLTDVLYSRVQTSMHEFTRRRAERLAAGPVASGAFSESPRIAWVIRGREVHVQENERPLFRAVWSSQEAGWRLYWSRTPGRWWPYATASHLTIGSFERCVREVERDPHGCFPPAEELAAAAS